MDGISFTSKCSLCVHFRIHSILLQNIKFDPSFLSNLSTDHELHSGFEYTALEMKSLHDVAQWKVLDAHPQHVRVCFAMYFFFMTTDTCVGHGKVSILELQELT